MATFTSTLPNHLLDLLNKKAEELKMPKNKLIEKALQIYLTQLNKAEYVRSYKQMAKDTDVLQMAEEGMGEYLAQLKERDR
ncbi:MAG TPA: CopG family transcriptional regulator [Bacteroidia bacterium]|nr:CopG family transcriptional regulator [Bacteroidia bacterium]